LGEPDRIPEDQSKKTVNNIKDQGICNGDLKRNMIIEAKQEKMDPCNKDPDSEIDERSSDVLKDRVSRHIHQFS
jgi:hypothetical protein